MPTTTNKQRQLTQLFAACKKGHDAPELGAAARAGAVPLRHLPRGRHPRARPTGPSRACASSFFDWNEVRVWSPREVEEAIADLPEAEVRAERLDQLPAGGLRDGLLLRPGRAAQEGAEAGRQAAGPLPGRQRLRGRLGGAAVAGRPRHPARRADPAHGPPAGPDRRRRRTTWKRPAPAWNTWSPRPRGRSSATSSATSPAEACWEDEPHCSACPLAGDCPTAQEHGAGRGRRRRRPRAVETALR